MSSIHFPVIIQLLLLATAVSIPIMRKKFDSIMKIFVVMSSLVAWILSVFTMANVFRNGAFL